MHKFYRKALSYLTALTAGSFAVLSGSAYAVTALPIDTLMQQAYMRAQGDDFKSLTKSLENGGNIYDSAYKLAKKTALGDIVGTFSSVANNLNQQYGCSLTSSDIATITTTNAGLSASFAGLAGKRALAVSGDVIVKSCVRVAQCVTKSAKASDVTSLANAYTAETYPLCTSTVQQAFVNTLGLMAKQNRLDAANHGDEIFFNGTLDDSPYDLLSDMQSIGNVLFSSNTQAPKVILYDFPKGGNGTTNNGLTFFDPTGDGDTNLAITSPANPLSPNKTAPATSPITNSLNGSNQAPSSALQQLVSYNQSQQQKIDAPSQNTTASTNSLLCVAPTTGISQNDLSDQQIIDNQTIQAENLEQALDTYNSAIDSPVALNDLLDSSQMQQATDTESALDNLLGNGNGGADPELDKIQACVAKCDTQAPADKVLCEAKCLCGTKYSSDHIFGISVCTVPVAKTEVIGGKSVKSIEEIITEINNVLTALKNSGQLMKHTKPKEFLDTSLSKIKLNQILSFDMNVAFKPIYSSHDKEEEKAKKASEDDAVLNRARQGSYSSIGEQKNKYLILPNPEKEQQQNTTLATEPATAAPSIDPALPYTLAKTLNNTMLDTISNFMQQSTVMRQQVSETFNAINTTSANLEKKIEKGN